MTGGGHAGSSAKDSEKKVLHGFLWDLKQIDKL